MAKEYKNLQEFLLNESAVFEKEEDTNPLYYMWGVLKSSRGVSDEDIKKSESLKALFKKIDAIVEKYPKQFKEIKKRFTPSEFLCSFRDASTEDCKKVIDWRLNDICNMLTYGIHSFNDWKEIKDDWDSLVNSDEMKTVISEL